MPELHPFDVIRRPIVSEKTNLLQSDHNKYTFEVAMEANKHQVKEAVELVFGIEPANVLQINTLIVPGKRGRRGRKVYWRQRPWKKAIVTLVTGSKIELFNV